MTSQGYGQQYKDFRLINILKAGHMAGMNQPYNFRDLVHRFIQTIHGN
jgi:carboxypeptidase C (cathepsin A)